MTAENSWKIVKNFWKTPGICLVKMSGHPEKGFFIVFEGPTLKETKKKILEGESLTLKNVKSTHGGVLLLVSLQLTLLKVALLHRCFSRFLNCTNGTQSCNTFMKDRLQIWLLIFSEFK